MSGIGIDVPRREIPYLIGPDVASKKASQMALRYSMLFAIATYRTAALSRGPAVLVGVGSALPFVSIPTNQPIFIVAALICVHLGWFLLGVQAIRLDRPAIDPRPV